MSRSIATVKALVARELEAIPSSCRDDLERLLIEPRQEALTWEYGAVDATRVCCVVAEAEKGLGLVYCEEGFGPKECWGFVSLAEGSMGRDDQWFISLYDAAIGAGLCDAPPGYEVA